MPKHLVSAIVRLLPALAWLCVVAVGLKMLLDLYLFMPGGLNGSGRTWLDALIACGFLALVAYGTRMAYKEYKCALPALRADTRIRIDFPSIRQPRHHHTPTRYPLADPLRLKLRQVIEALEAAGVLQVGEVELEEIIDCAELTDEYSEMEILEVAKILHALQPQRERRFANLAFFADQVEIDELDVLAIVHEFARLSAQSEHLGAVRLKAIGGRKIVSARRGEFPPSNAVVEFELGAQHCAVPLVMYSKNIPGGLMEGLAKVFTRAGDPRRFVCANFDTVVSLSYLAAEKTSTLNSTLSGEFAWFEAIE